jgi:hypothetical protein
MSNSIYRLADRHRTILAKLNQRADALVQRLEALDVRGNKAMTDHESVLNEAEVSIAMVEDTINQLTNGGPPLDDTPKPPAGVTLNPDYKQVPKGHDYNGVTSNPDHKK